MKVAPLHEGPLSLVRAALQRADRVILTSSRSSSTTAADVAAYPPTEHEDAAKLLGAGCFTRRKRDVSRVVATCRGERGERRLCVAFGDGVARLVTKLFSRPLLVRPSWRERFPAVETRAPFCPLSRDHRLSEKAQSHGWAIAILSCRPRSAWRSPKAKYC
ncbi:MULTISPECIES: pantoate--beta-alanine ligase [Mesorhizobium]|uniref:Uncharacterized protein n=1 Tax=Mesorhizobium erdmanii TaxID=1777866 RepID=A0A6M7UQS2_9HYPH|nr:hypothetical protein EB233_31130 [Mesorhizobium erdmanii]